MVPSQEPFRGTAYQGIAPIATGLYLQSVLNGQFSASDDAAFIAGRDCDGRLAQPRLGCQYG